MKENMYGKMLGIYCERGMDAGFWAEPLNALSNLAFIFAAIVLIVPARRDGRAMNIALTAMIFVIGIGSFLFHSLANRWSEMADVLPILFFMLMAVGTMGARALPFKHWALGGAAALLTFAALIACTHVFSAALTAIVGGSVSYLPAWSMLMIGGVGLLVFGNRHQKRTGALFLAAGVIFTLSLTARVIDKPYCEMWRISSRQLGTHFIWHLLNAVTLTLTSLALFALPHKQRLK